MPSAINVGSFEALADGIAAWYAQALDTRHPRGNGRRLARLLGREFDGIYSRLATFAAEPGSSEASGLEWLLDNHHVVRAALNQLRRDLPPGHYRRLPAVRDPRGRAVPRLLEVSRLLLDATGLPLDLERLQVAMGPVQDRSPLRLSELWALPVFLRAVLLQRLAGAATRLLTQSGSATGDSNEEDTGADAAATVISSSILSLRHLATFRWANLVERTSLVEAALQGDPASVYAGMDFASRDRYRAVVEDIADRCGLAEPHVARTAVEMAAAQTDDADPRLHHVGFYLVDRGREALERQVGARPNAADRLRQLLRRHATRVYLGLILLPSLALLLIASAVLVTQGLAVLWTLLFALVAAVPAISLSTAAGNWLVTHLVPPRILPRFDFEYGISSDWPTVVVMPAILTSASEVRRLARNLEMNYLGNADAALQFALLTDFPDAATQHAVDDDELVALAVAAIDELNARYGDDASRPFALFHRRRQWNGTEGRWMGWERKRGKLVEFNRLLLGDPDTSFELCHGDLDGFRRARLVITLDADTRMPAGVAASLVGILAHPLNRPETDPSTGRVVRGYTAVQPRIEIDPSSVDETPYARLLAGDVALDPYVHAVSDVYQDLFDVGIYAGKGAYDLRAFQASVAGRIPDNVVLSHDLLEGLHGRVAYASDVMLLEDFPPNPAVMMRRMHRWVRGDWQLLRWLRSGHRGTRGTAPLAQLNLIDRWKIVDNLRRSLQPIALVALLLLVWLKAPQPLLWTAVIVVLPGAPAAMRFIAASRTAAWRWGTWMSTVRAVASRVADEILRWLISLALLAFEAWVVADAIVRALYRQWVTQSRLLEWEPAAAMSARLGSAVTVGRSYLYMWPSWAIGLTALGLVAWQRPVAFAAAAPLAALWCSGPLFAARLGRSTPPRAAAPLTAAEVSELRALARRTWRFFEQFVGPDGHWLPPDNVQTAPAFQVARRTSPTNIGLTLLATLSAHDFGYLTRTELVARLRNTLDSIGRLARYRGHLYNWYEMRNLQPLEPRYVSTVDSGNFVAALITVRQGLLALRGAPSSPRRIYSGLADTLLLLERLLRRSAGDAGNDTATGLAVHVAEARRALTAEPHDGPDALISLAELVAGKLEPGLIRMIERSESPAQLGQLDELRGWLHCLSIEVAAARRDRGVLGQLESQIDRLCADIDRVVTATDFHFLFDPQRRLFRIGYNVSAGELDGSYYDLLASEARIASFVAIGKGDAPTAHWVHLGRPLRRVRGHRVLLSWSATAFEYFMPRLLMKTPESGLLYQSCLVAVAEQRRAARRLGIPWGMSESAYFQMDLQGEYQYRAFGLSKLALRREQSDRVVIAPYASVLALPFDADAVLSNLRAFAGLKLDGSYGLAEAADFGHASGDFSTRPRIVQAFMAHHQGMILTALGNAVHGDLMLRRFHADPQIASVEYLLYERMPKRPQAQPLQAPLAVRPRRIQVAVQASEWQVDPSRPALNILSNGHLRTLTTAQGGGASYWNDLMLNRWRPEVDGEYGGAALFFRDLDSGEVWSLGWDEFGSDVLAVNFSAHLTEFKLRRQGLMVRLSITIAPDGDLEARRLIFSNELDRPRRLQVGFQSEPVMAPEAEDRRHPAFNKLFIERDESATPAALLFRRRPRAADEPPLFLGYAVAAHAEIEGTLQCHSDRLAFIGRRGDPRRPAAFVTEGGAATPAIRPVLDPVAALTLTLAIPPLASVPCAFLTAVGRDQNRVLDLFDRHRSLGRVAWIFSQARTAAEQEMRLLGLHDADVSLAMSQARQLLWPRRHAALEQSRAAQESLWARGLSGDHPVTMLRVRGPEDLGIAELLLRTHALFRRRGFESDLVLLDESSAGYSQPTRDRLASLIERSRELPAHQRRGLVVIVPARDLSSLERANLIAAAGLFLDPDVLDPEQALRESVGPQLLPAFVPVPSAPLETTPIAAVPRPRDLVFDNGYGGFSPDGREYRIYIEAGRHPPVPWVNVMSNPDFGAIVSDGGLGCTWAGNSSENRLTPWFNDPVTDRAGEACFLRDEESAVVWSPTPLPLPGPSAYRVSHGAGYSRFEHNSQGLEQQLTVFVDASLPVKFVRLSLKNRWPRARRITATLALDWVLGNDRHQTGHWLVSGYGPDGRILTVRNAFDRMHPEHTAFLTATLPPHAITIDRGDFLGRARNARQVPAALRAAWPGTAASNGGDSCAAYQVHLMMDRDETAEVTFIVGFGATRAEALELARVHQDKAEIEKRWSALERRWDELLGSLQVDTPDAAWNLLANRWLLYQSLSCRLWGRSGYFQPGGAYGFRDQLQDVLALLQVDPNIAREQILRAASVQFKEGDVLHWWHASPLRGVRSRCSDDLLWLPFATAAYVSTTGDATVLDSRIPYLAGEPLTDSQMEQYAEFPASWIDDTLYDHCCRAIEIRLATGDHGLPPIGAGDWNDGLSRVGIRGRGESVWMAWFMIRVCRDFAPLCEGRGEPERASQFRQLADRLAEAANGQAWDGQWFLRGFHDDGAPLGGHAGEVCQIDLNAQTWAVLADAAPRDRQVAAMQSVQRRLADTESKVLRLLAPSFDRGGRDVGYIQGYPPGVRENGSQYNHAAVWAVWAAADLGWRTQAREWLDWINPIARTATAGDVERYALEPYAVAGDIYYAGALVGRGGWSWYTGAAPWLYRVLIERLLGLQRRGARLRIRPCLPEDWPGYRATLRHGTSRYVIQVESPHRRLDTPGVVELDGRTQTDEWLELVDDGQEHTVVVKEKGTQPFSAGPLTDATPPTQA